MFLLARRLGRMPMSLTDAIGQGDLQEANTESMLFRMSFGSGEDPQLLRSVLNGYEL